MALYRLVASSGTPNIVASEIILERNDTGEVTASVSVSEPRELSEQQLAAAREAAGVIAYRVEEVQTEQAAEGSQGGQDHPTGADSAAGSPLVTQDDPGTGDATAESSTGGSTFGGSEINTP